MAKNRQLGLVFILANKVLALAANDGLISFPLGVTSSNKKTGPSDELGKNHYSRKISVFKV